MERTEKISSKMQYPKVIAGLVIAGVIIGLGVMYSGVINVAATYPHSSLTRWGLHTAMKQSVKYHASNISVPSLNRQDQILNGFRHYREMCTGCHLVPGVSSSEIRKGLMPVPPKLQQTVKTWTPAELFWIIKNGVRMTAMPAWGPSHNDEKIWEMVAFLEKFPGMTKAQYDEMDKQAGQDVEDDD